MILGTLDGFDSDDETPFRTRVGWRALPPREVVIVEPDEPTLLDQAVACNAFGGIWLTVQRDDVREIKAMWIAGVAQFSDDLRMWQLTVQGAQEMGLLPVEQLAYPDAEIAREAGASELGEGE